MHFFYSIFGSMVWEILGARKNPFSIPKVGKKSNNVKYINNVIVHIWIIQFHDQFLFYSDVVIDYWLWTVKAWKISPITWQSPCWNVPVLGWSQKLFPGWEQSFDMIWFWKISCLFTILFFSWNWFHGKGIKTKFWYKIHTIHVCSHVKRATSHALLQYPPQIFFFEWDSVIEKIIYLLLLIIIANFQNADDIIL